MIRKYTGLMLWLLCLLFFPMVFNTILLAKGDDIPPVGSLPLSVLLKDAELRESGFITEAEFENGLWEIELSKTGEGLKLYYDPMNGEVVRQKNRRSSEEVSGEGMLISAIVQSLEHIGLGHIVEVELEDGLWGVELLGERRKYILLIDPITGAMLN
jgi:hypothetical protein